MSPTLCVLRWKPFKYLYSCNNPKYCNWFNLLEPIRVPVTSLKQHLWANIKIKLIYSNSIVFVFWHGEGQMYTTLMLSRLLAPRFKNKFSSWITVLIHMTWLWRDKNWPSSVPGWISFSKAICQSQLIEHYQIQINY